MSLGVTAILQSSRHLLYWRMAGALVLFATAVALALDPFLLASGLPGRLFCVNLAAASAGCLVMSASRRSCVRFLSITADGRLFVAYGGRSNTVAAQTSDTVLESTAIRSVTLLPWFIFLRLRLASGGCRTLFIARDSVAPETFRRLSVALRWIVRHNDPAQCGMGSAK